MKKLLLLPLLGLTACGNMPDSPQGSYLVLDQTYQVVLRASIAYAEECKALPTTNPCHETLPAMRSALDQADKAFDQADQVFAGQDATYYALALTTARVALDNLQAAYLKRNAQ